MAGSRGLTANLWYFPFANSKHPVLFSVYLLLSHLCLLLLPILFFPQGGAKLYYTAGISSPAGPRVGQWYERMLMGVTMEVVEINGI